MQNMFQFHYISAKSVELFDSWINDLQRSHYLEPPVIPRRRGQMNPCLGADGLYGVAFYPALPVRPIGTAEHLRRRNITLDRYRKEERLLTDHHNRAHQQAPSLSAGDLPVPVTQGPGTDAPAVETEELYDIGAPVIQEEEPVSSLDDESTHDSPITSRHAKIYDGHGALEMPIVREFTDNICPGYSQLLPHTPAAPLNNILLIVAMTAMRYEMIPVFEVVYREQFRNILYCGSPHDSIEIFLRKYQLSEDRSFSFLPVHSKYTYECLLGALEMGYNVDGWIMATDDALINSWNLHSMNYSKLWYSGDDSRQVTANNWQTLDPGSQKLPRSLDGVQKVLEFLKSSLIGSVLAGEEIGSFGLPLDDGHSSSSSRLVKREAVIEGTRIAPVLDKVFVDKIDSGRINNQTQETVPIEIPIHLHATGGRLIFDVIELKSVAPSIKTDERPTAGGTKSLSSLNYVIEAERNVTIPSSDVPDSSLPQVHENSTTPADLALPPDSADSSDLATDVEEDLASSLADGEDDEEHRPVSEVLRQLLVATRNNTSPSADQEPIDYPVRNDSISSESPVIFQMQTNHNETMASVPLEISVGHISSETSVDSDKNRSNPIIDLFLHPTAAANKSSSVEPTPTALANSFDRPNVGEPAPTEVKLEAEQTDVVHQENNQTAPFPTHSSSSTTVPSITQQPAFLHEDAITQKSTTTTTSEASVSVEEERKMADTLHVEETLATLKGLYSSIKENLGVQSDDDGDDIIQVAGYTEDATFYGGDRGGYRLNPKWIHHFRCEKGTNLEFCKVSSEFLYQLSENIGKEFRLIYDQVPMYYIPKRDQLKFYLLSNLMLQHGVTDEIAIPLMLSGLDPEDEWIKLDKSYFGEMKGRNGEATAPNKYPLFNSESAVLFPVDLNAVTTDPKFQKVFCLKYLLRLLQQ